jgi:ATP-dependent Lhr-like helicase
VNSTLICPEITELLFLEKKQKDIKTPRKRVMVMNQFTKTDQEIMDLFEDYVQEWMVSTFDRLTPPQREALPLIASGENTLIFSPTGSGKTLAAFLFCINELFKLSVSQELQDTIYVLYVSPLRALSNDIHKNLYQPLRGIYSILKKKNIH